MTISTLDDYISAVKQVQVYYKSASVTSLAGVMAFTIFDQAGAPGAGTLSAGNTANGIVPTDALAGYPIINAFGGSAKGYLSKVEFSAPVAMRITLYDRLFSCGAYAYNADTTLASQPTYSSRVPSGTNYTGLELWLEQVTAGTGVQGIQVNYLDEGGNAGDTGVQACPAAMIIRRCYQIPLAAGDCGVSQIVRVRGSTASAGTFNINVLRPLWAGRVKLVNDGDIHDLLRTGLIQVWEDSALYVMIAADSTATSTPLFHFEIAVK